MRPAKFGADHTYTLLSYYTVDYSFSFSELMKVVYPIVLLNVNLHMEHSHNNINDSALVEIIISVKCGQLGISI